MTKIDKARVRDIIDDFAKEIEIQKISGGKPEYSVIYFREDYKNKRERKIYDVPIGLLRFRKDNGRIRADVISYEKETGVLDEKKTETQDELRNMLAKNDPEKNLELKKLILHDGQREPAIITCDGFLINGNRRKMVIDGINKEIPGRVKYMKVVILPGNNEEGGPPTLLEIEMIENRYQQQKEGKADYTKFNTALSIKRKTEMGMTLDEQLRDDPYYADLTEKQFTKEKKNFQEEYLKPLDCIDRYLETLGREGLYNTIVSGSGDREGRWQAFLDYYKSVYKKIIDEKQRLDNLHINESDVGKIEDIAFKIIRQRVFTGQKAHQIMRNMTEWIKIPDAKKELFEITKIPHKLDNQETIDESGKEVDENTKDKIWVNKNRTILERQIIKAKQIYEHEKFTETPIDLLEAALRKLEDDDLVIQAIARTDIPKTKYLIKRIKEVIGDLETELYHHEKKN